MELWCHVPLCDDASDYTLCLFYRKGQGRNYEDKENAVIYLTGYMIEPHLPKIGLQPRCFSKCIGE